MLAAALTSYAQFGNEDVSGILREIAAQQEALRRPGTSTQQRLETLDRIQSMRRERLISAFPDDPRLAVWLADQASDLFFELLPTDAAGLTSLFGLPSATQMDRARRVACEMNELTARAQTAVETAITDLEANPRYSDDLELQRLRRGLDRDERRRRIPFLRGVAAFLHAELNVREAAESDHLYRVAADLLDPLSEQLDDPLAGRARAYAGLSLVRLGSFGRADEMLSHVASSGTSHANDVFAARMGSVWQSHTEAGPDAAVELLESVEGQYSDPAMVFYRVLIADQRFLLRREIADSAAAGERDAMLALALDSYIGLLGAETGVKRDDMRAIVMARLQLAADRDLPLAQLPPIVSVASALRLVREDGRAGEAVATLEALLQRADLDEEDYTATLEMLGRALVIEGRPVEATNRLLELAVQYPASSRAERAAEYAARVAAEQYRNSPGSVAARQVLDQALEVVLGQYPDAPSINRWRYLAGRLAAGDGRWAAANELLQGVTGGAAQWLDAQFMIVSNERAAARAEVDPVARIERCERIMPLIERVRGALDEGIGLAGDASREARLRYYLSFLRVFEAEALTVMSRTDRAIDVLAGIEDEQGLSPTILAAALQARIEAHRRAGRDDQARRELEAFVLAAPAQAGLVISPMMAETQAEVQRLIQDGRDDRAVELARNDLLPLAVMMEQWLTGGRGASVAETWAMWRQTADGYRLGGRPESALGIYERLLGRRPDGLELLLGRAECLFAIGGDDLAEAMGIFKRIVAAGVGQEETQHRAYWQAQLRMLQILDLAQRNTHQIVPRVRRLRKQDPSLGGPGFARRFQQLENKYAGT